MQAASMLAFQASEREKAGDASPARRLHHLDEYKRPRRRRCSQATAPLWNRCGIRSNQCKCPLQSETKDLLFIAYGSGNSAPHSCETAFKGEYEVGTSRIGGRRWKVRLEVVLRKELLMAFPSTGYLGASHCRRCHRGRRYFFAAFFELKLSISGTPDSP